MPNPEYTREIEPREAYRLNDVQDLYWVRDGKVFFLGAKPVRGAHAPTFRYYLGGFAKDRKNCYSHGSRLRGGNPETFRSLNFCYATDGESVWTMGGKVKGADAKTFQVCDDGSHPTLDVPYGYGKDTNRVYYYDFDGKPNWVRKANPETFVSLNDGYFGKDHQFVFCGIYTLPKANVHEWTRLAGQYSKDVRCVFYFNRPMQNADPGSFFVFTMPGESLQIARDKNVFFAGTTTKLTPPDLKPCWRKASGGPDKSIELPRLPKSHARVRLLEPQLLEQR